MTYDDYPLHCPVEANHDDSPFTFEFGRQIDGSYETRTRINGFVHCRSCDLLLPLVEQTECWVESTHNSPTWEHDDFGSGFACCPECGTAFFGDVDGSIIAIGK